MEKRTFKKVIVTIAVSLVILSTGILVQVVSSHDPKIGLVDSNLLLSEFKGMQDLKIHLLNKKNSYQGDLDSVKYQLNLKNKIASNPEGNGILMAYEHKLQLKYQEEEAKLLKGILDQINQFIAEYAVENGFDIILGGNDLGNIVYAKEEYDLTQQIIKELNEHYNN